MPKNSRISGKLKYFTAQYNPVLFYRVMHLFIMQQMKYFMQSLKLHYVSLM